MLTSENPDFTDALASLSRIGIGARSIREKSTKSRVVKVMKNIVREQ
jgi:hypothetical protein